MANGTLANLAHSAFVRTPRALGQRIVHNLLRFPSAWTLLDPTAGEGDLLYPTLSIPGARRFGIEISAERAAVAREVLGSLAQIMTSAAEAVHVPHRSMSLVLANPPYFFTNGKRAEYVIISRAGEALMPGGIMVAIIPARSAWDAVMMNHWARWYTNIRVWKFPNRDASEDEEAEGAFEDFTQICVVGVRRAEPVDVDPAERRRLQGYRWRIPRDKGEDGSWEYGTPPPELPTAPIDDPYLVPPSHGVPELVIRHADEATLLEALAQSGAHRSTEWDSATYWPEEETNDFPTMPLTGAAHLAAAILNDAVGGQTISGPEEGPHEQHCLFTAFIGSQWVKLPIGREEREKMRESGVITASARQWQDQPVLGVMDLDSGASRYYEGNAALTFLQPWLARLAERVTSQHPPLYLLDPADWELQVLTQFATDKQLPGADFPGLAPAQLHRVCAMGRILDNTGKTAIQGEPGTGKTRLGTGTAARQAYRWRARHQAFVGQRQPAWLRQLRRAWLKNPRTLAMLGLVPVYGERLPNTSVGTPQIREDPTSRQLVAYREIRTSKLILPEDAGPRALPVLVTTPKKVTKEYGREIQAAWPQAEVMHIERYQDVPRWLQRCAESSAPAVVGIFSHSTSRAFGCEWLPAVLERTRMKTVPDLAPPDRAHLKAVYDRQGRLQGYCAPGSDQLVTTRQEQTSYLCPDCLSEIQAVPGAQLFKEDATANLADQFKTDAPTQDMVMGEKQLVTSRVFFEKRPRWCRCQDRRNQERSKRGAKPQQHPLWTRAWRKDLREKYPALSYAQWQQAPAVSRAVPSSFSPYEYLYQEFRGCVALTIVDESHNGRGASTDIAHAHHLAMLAAQTRMLTSGTHFGGDVLSFYHYWFRYDPAFWKGLGLGWRDAAKALKLFGVIQEWTREYESTAHKGSGQTDVRVSTIAAPGLSGKLIPRLLTRLVYLTVLDVGAYMPPRIEIPELVNMRDEEVRAAQAEAKAITSRVQAERSDLYQERTRLLQRLEKDEAVRPEMTAFTARTAAIAVRHTEELALADERWQWAKERDLDGEHRDIVQQLERLSRNRNQTARMGKGTIPRWFTALPCETPFTLEQTLRGPWGEELGKQLLLTTNRLQWDYRYPAEAKVREIVDKELAEKRRVMVYIEQNELRSMAKRLAWVFKDIPTWTLPNSVKSEDRQQAILDAVQQRGIHLLFVPYRKVNEGLNLQAAVDTIIWYELAMNLFLLDQASRRAWRLGKQEEVRIYYLVYGGTAGHSKLRKLGNQSGAAAAFAGEPARGALIEQAGADKTTLARLAAIVDAQQSLVEEDEDEEEDASFTLTYSNEEAEQLKAAFARRAEEERAALQRGRQWLGGVNDTLSKRLPAFFLGAPRPSIWQTPLLRRTVVTPEMADAWAETRVVEKMALLPAPTEATQPGVASPIADPQVGEGKATTAPVTALPQPESETKKATRAGRAPAQRKPRTGSGQKAATPAGTPDRLVFGNEEHIALVRRPKRARKPASLKHPKRTSPVEVKTIAAVDEAVVMSDPQIQVMTPSLWDAVEETMLQGWSQTTVVPEQPVEDRFEQLRLW